MSQQHLPTQGLLQPSKVAEPLGHGRPAGVAKLCSGASTCQECHAGISSPCAYLQPQLSTFSVSCSYVQGLFALAHDTHSGVRKAVCAGLVQMLQLQPEKLAPHMEQIIEYMLESTQVFVNSTAFLATCDMPVLEALRHQLYLGHYYTLHVCMCVVRSA